MRDNISSIFKEGCLVALSVSRWGHPRKIPKAILEARDADKDWVSGYKKLINPAAIKPINTAANKAVARIKRYALPFPIRGIWFVPKALIERLDLELKGDQNELEQAADEFSDKFTEYVYEAESKLGVLFDRTQYPRDIRSRFGLTWRFFYLDVPSNELGILSPQQYKEEMEKMRDTILDAKNMAITALRTQLHEILKSAVDKLHDKEAQRIHSSLLGKFREFFATFADRNIFGDTKLEEIVELCRDALDGVEIEEIKSDEDYKAEVAKELAEVQEKLEKAMVREPSRKLRLDPRKAIAKYNGAKKKASTYVLEFNFV